MSEPHSSRPSLQHWKSLTREANQAFALLKLDQALALYERASAVAEHLLMAELTPDTAIATYVVSCLNLADAWERIGNAERAAQELIQVHQRLAQIADDPRLDQGYRDAALCHSRRSLLELQHFLRTHEHPGISRLLQAALLSTHRMN